MTTATKTAKTPKLTLPKTPAPSGQTMMDRSVCLTVTLRRMGTRRRVASERVEVRDTVKEQQPETDAIRVGKFLLESDELDAIKQLDGQVRHYIYAKALPADFIRDGVYLVPLELLATVDTELGTYAAKRTALVEAFLAAYPALCEKAKDRLRALYNPAEYPDVRTVRDQFSFRWSYVAFETPGKISKISRAIFEREAEKMEQELAGAAETVRQALREAMGDVVDEMVKKMTDVDGKAKVFKGSSIRRVQDFLDTFKARNLTDDNAIQVLVDKAARLVKGIAPDTLREDATLRADIRKGFESIKAAITPMLTARTSRAVSFDE